MEEKFAAWDDRGDPRREIVDREETPLPPGIGQSMTEAVRAPSARFAKRVGSSADKLTGGKKANEFRCSLFQTVTYFTGGWGGKAKLG